MKRLLYAKRHKVVRLGSPFVKHYLELLFFGKWLLSTHYYTEVKY